jgi:dTDP-4-amino-4,6-dideoxygalactose transaminase
MIPFNRPYLTGNELEYIKDAVLRGKISGNGYYTQKCQNYFQDKYNFMKCLLTTSCTDALEMAAILCDIKPGDEVIVPSYTFVSSANAFVLRGARIVFADSRNDHPGMDEKSIESLITPRTKVILPVHYAGVACDMDYIMAIAEKYNLTVVEDAAQAIDSFYKSKPLGSIGHLGCFSFHETKNIQCGEGGMLVINNEHFLRRAEIIWEKGTNRAEFFRGEINKYGWVDIGSSFLPSELIAAFLWSQIEKISEIQRRRLEIWQWYNENASTIFQGFSFSKPFIPSYATNNAHMFYLILNSLDERTRFINQLKLKNVLTVFHYLSLHKSPFYINKHDNRSLPNSDHYEECLVRLPLFYELNEKELLSSVI